jgi:hypothetical protein
MSEKIIDKIKKLAAKAESAKEIGNIEEAAIFSAKVSELLTQHNLDMASLQTEEEQPVSGEKFFDMKVNYRWKVDLLTVLCEYNYCEAIYHRHFKDVRYNRHGRYTVYEKEKSVSIIGRPENVEVVRYLYSMLVSQFEAMAGSAWMSYLADVRKRLAEMGYSTDSRVYKDPAKYTNATSAHIYKTSFYKGAVSGVLRKLKEQMKAAEQKHGAKITDLVLVNNAAVQAYVKENFPGLGTMRNGGGELDASAYRKGVKAGENASMARGVATGDQVATRMLNS